MVFSSNLQRLTITASVLIFGILLNSCGDPIANQVRIQPEPDNPVVVKADLPEAPDGSQVTAPWFLLDYKISNNSDQRFVLIRMEIESSRIGSNESSTFVIDISSLEEDEDFSGYPRAIAVVEPKKEWISSKNAGLLVDSERQGAVWYIGGLPVDVNETVQEQTTLYEVNVTTTGFFTEDTDDDDSNNTDDIEDRTVYEGSFRFFTE